MAKIILPKDLSGNDLFKFLVEHKETIISQKKSAIKLCDPFMFDRPFISEKGVAVKAEMITPDQATGVITVNPVINTTYLMDSHDDVHIDGIWKENLKTNKIIYLIQEHKSNQFDKLITKDLKPITKKLSWRDLGQDYDGVTEALIFSNCKINDKRNPYMYSQYKNGYVENHSVGMIYVRLALAINNPDWKDEFAEWNKHLDKIANKDEAMSQGYFWPVYEAKIVEGSAVPFGSNWATPTLDENMQLVDSRKEKPGTPTPPTPQFNLRDAIDKTTFIN